MHYLCAVLVIFTLIEGKILQLVAASQSGCNVHLPSRIFAHNTNSPNLLIVNDSLVTDNTSVEYTCQENSMLRGSKTNVCLDGIWNATIPTCVVFCSTQILSMQSITVTCDYAGKTVACIRPRPGTLAKISCSLGYRLPNNYQSDVLRCGDDGQWDFSAFECEVICGLIPLSGQNEPWHVGIYRNNTSEYTYTCGGTIISTRFIVSANRCFSDGEIIKSRNLKNYMVAVGKYYRDYDATEPLKVQYIQISGYRHHSNNGPAILRLADHIVLMSHVMPICTENNSGSGSLASETNVRMVGWKQEARSYGYGNGRVSNEQQILNNITFAALERCKQELQSKQPISNELCHEMGTNAFFGSGVVYPKEVNGIKNVYHLRWVIISNGFPLFHGITFSRSMHLNLTKDTNSTCINPNGSTELFRCEHQGNPVSCAQPKPGTTATIDCSTNHNLKNEFTIYCGDDGEWSLPAMCYLSCGLVMSVGIIDIFGGGLYDNGQCSTGKSSQAVLRQIEESTPASSTCILKLPPNMYATYGPWQNDSLSDRSEVADNTFITYGCRGRFRTPENRGTNLCLNGQWIDTTPSCVPHCAMHELNDPSLMVTCERMGQQVQCEKPTVGTLAKIRCAEGYVMPQRYVNDAIRCDDEGEWDFTAFKCDLTCGILQEGTQLVPWHVGIFSNRLTNTGEYTLICGGTILSVKLVISASHCFWDNQSKQFLSEKHFKIGVGKHYTDYNAVEPLKVQKIGVSEIIHRSINDDITTNYQSDIALLILAENILWSWNALPVCIEINLSYNEKMARPDGKGFFPGWGSKIYGGYVGTEIKVFKDISVISWNECKNSVDSAFVKYLTSDKLCAGLAPDMPVNMGDSGGGLVFPVENFGRNNFYLRGIVSNGQRSPQNSTHYKLFVNVMSHAKFIMTQLLQVSPETSRLSDATGCIVKLSARMLAYHSDQLRPNRLITDGDRVANFSSIRYECQGRSVMFAGFDTNTCQDGVWTRDIPICQNVCLMQQLIDSSITVTCEYENEGVSCQLPIPGTLANIRCANGYSREAILQSIQSIQCGDNGEWNSTVISCIKTNRVMKIKETTPERSVETTTNNININNEEIFSAEVTQSTPTVLSCILQLTPNMLALHGAWPNLQISDDSDVRHNTLIKYECHGNYRHIGGPIENSCNNGSWANVVPSCEPICLILEIIDPSVAVTCTLHGLSVSCSEPVPGTLATIKCNVGYAKPQRDVNDVLRCNENGDWDLTPFKCDLICGIVADYEEHIIGGRPGNNTQIPWQVAIYRDARNEGNFGHICGGSILNAKVIISAAHCYYDKVNWKFFSASQYAVATGKYYRDYKATEPLWVQKIAVAKIHHPREYVGIRLNHEADMALLVLADHIVMMPYVTPICMEYNLRMNEKFVPSNWKGLVAGWGDTTSDGSPSTVLQVLDGIPSIDLEKCKEVIHNSYVKYVTVDKFCAGFEENKRMSTGDSGGGWAFAKQFGRVKIYYLRGVVSGGPNFATGNHTHHYTIFTNIQYYSDLIFNVTRSEHSTSGMECQILLPLRMMAFRTGRSHARIANETIVRSHTLVKYECNGNSTLGVAKHTNFCLNGKWLNTVPICKVF